MQSVLDLKTEPGLSTLQQRAAGAYLGLAVGDALGATVEFMTPREIAAHHGRHTEIIGGGWLRLKPGQVTDDTTMSLALGEAILAEGGQVVAKTVAEAFSNWMKAKPVDIGNTVRRGLMQFGSTGATQIAENPHSAGNGAVMRLLPTVLVGLDKPEEDMLRDVLLQAHITHRCEESDKAAETVALMLRFALLGKTKSQVMAPIQDLYLTLPSFKPKRRSENPSGYVVDTLQAVFQALEDTNRFEECLIDVVNRGGDADTTGAIAGMIAGALYGVEAIPPRWERKLGPMADLCQEQALRLCQL